MTPFSPLLIHTHAYPFITHASTLIAHSAESNSDDAKEAEDEQRNVGTKMNANRNGGAKMSVRNLRIREDTAKYLLNLDQNSAYYDPKTRSMRDNPLAEGDLRMKSADFVPYNQMKQTGDARKLAALQL